VKLSITHISDCSDLGANFDVSQSRETAPDDYISGCRISGPRQIAAQSCEFDEVESKGSRSTPSMADVAHHSVEQCDLSIG